MAEVKGGPLQGVREQPASGWSVLLAGAIGPHFQDFSPPGVCGSLHLSHLKMLPKAKSVALATAASFNGAALGRMGSGPGRVQHKRVTSLC